jgi:hypothetical protein
MIAFSASASDLLWWLLREKLFGRLLQKRLRSASMT